ncbi:MAG: hypothetical protein AB7E42_01640 [Anaerotignaceae bacterium]
MKKIIFIAVLLLIVMASGGCQYKKSSEILDFDVSQIESVDIYSGSVSDDVKKKRVTIPDDIDSIVKSFSKIRICWQEEDVVVAEDSTEINMCFKLNDGSEKLIMVNGKVVSCDLGNYYVSGNMFDVVFYNSLRYPEEQVEEMDITLAQPKKDPEKSKLPQRIQGLEGYGNAFRQYIKDLYLNFRGYIFTE